MVITTIKQLPNTHRWLLIATLIIGMILLVVPSEPVNASRHSASELEIGKRYPLELTLQSTEIESQPEYQPKWQTFKVKRGDTLAAIFKRAGLTPKDTHQVSTAGKLAKRLLKIKPGETLEIAKDKNQKLLAVKYQFSAIETLTFSRDESGKYQGQIDTKDVETRLAYAQGSIKNNFWNAGIAAGLTDNLVMSVGGIFQWDIDFALELRKGDEFNLVYEQEFVDGEYIGDGDILAAEFVNQGDLYTAIRHTDGNYYTPDGKSMRKSFLRAPVNFKYISSNFNMRRFHPIQKRIKPHRGIDYAAPTGTPVMAAGDGKVIKSGYDRFNGHHVFLQHGETYQTKYIHFSKRAVKKGQSVKQGQIIGYVGNTGMSAGPHLHYEFLVNGVHKNPRTVKLPKADPIAKSEKAEFLKIAKTYQGHLDTNRRIMLAMNPTQSSSAGN